MLSNQIKDRENSMLSLIKTAHSGQFRNSGKVPYWCHCQNTAFIIKDAFSKSKELLLDNSLLIDIYIAALGHDLYEDTDVKPQQIKNDFGIRVDEYIEFLTNFQDDNNRFEYLQKIKNASEEVKIIKLGDSIDNAIGAAYGIQDMGISWTKDFLIPIINETQSVLKQNRFTKYPKTAKILIDLLDFSSQRLKQNLTNFEQI